MRKINKKGITLTSLIVTVIILLILAGVGIGTLGPNGFVAKAEAAKEKAQIDEEKEIVGTSVIQSAGNNRYGNIEKTELETYLEKNAENRDIEVVEDEGSLVVSFKDTDRHYKIDDDGNFQQYDLPEQTPIPNKSATVSEIGRSKGSIDIVFLSDTGYEISETPNIPTLDDTMVPVYYDEASTNWIVCSEEDTENWYNYEIQTSTTDTGGTSRWANVMLTDDLVVEKDGVTYDSDTIKNLTNLDNIVGATVTTEGSMLVWIPRYAYKITYEDDKGNAIGYSDSRGIVTLEGETPNSYETPTTSINVNGNIGDTTYEYYRPHPAFENGTYTGFTQGEWDKRIKGIWVGKFEVTGNVSEVTVKSNTRGLTGKNVGDMYEAIKENFKAGTTESHMIKNSEWGAIVYLAESKYGRNGTMVSKNNNGQNAYTGQGDYKTNILQSTTGNIYGVYDLRGGMIEFSTGYIANGNSNGKNGYQFVSRTGTAGAINDKEESTKYATVYQYAKETDTETDNYNLSLNKVFGDSITETSIKGSGDTSWKGGNSIFPCNSEPFLMRGRAGSDAGSQIFTFYRYHGGGYADLFTSRVVCISE